MAAAEKEGLETAMKVMAHCYGVSLPVRLVQCGGTFVAVFDLGDTVTQDNTVQYNTASHPVGRP